MKKKVLAMILTVFMYAGTGCSLTNNYNDKSSIKDKNIMSTKTVATTTAPASKIIPFEAIDLKDNTKKGPEIFTKSNNLLLIWQSDCEPCRIFLESLNEVWKDYPKVNVIGLSVDTDDSKIKEKIKDLKLEFNNYKSTKDYLETIKTKTTKTPSLFVLDKNGFELMKEVGNITKSNEKEVIKKHLKEILEKYNK